MTAVDVPIDDDIMDFSRPPENIRFRMDGDVFEAIPEIAAVSMLRFADDAERLDRSDVSADEKVKILQNLFRMILVPESSSRFIRRLDDNTNPIGVGRFMDVTKYLLERYGLRPTEPDSAS